MQHLIVIRQEAASQTKEDLGLFDVELLRNHGSSPLRVFLLQC